jgi:5-methylcytosine-specific restriction endonuclease McrA
MKKNIFEFAPLTPKSFVIGEGISPLFPYPKSNEKPKRTPCPKAVKEAVWKIFFGNSMVGNCYVCGADITFTNFELGHNKPHTKGGKWVVENLRPLCRTCNRSIGDKMTVEAFKKKYFSHKSKPATSKTKSTIKPKSAISQTTKAVKPKSATLKTKSADKKKSGTSKMKK